MPRRKSLSPETEKRREEYQAWRATQEMDKKIVAKLLIQMVKTMRERERCFGTTSDF